MAVDMNTCNPYHYPLTAGRYRLEKENELHEMENVTYLHQVAGGSNQSWMVSGNSDRGGVFCPHIWVNLPKAIKFVFGTLFLGTSKLAIIDFSLLNCLF